MGDTVRAGSAGVPRAARALMTRRRLFAAGAFALLAAACDDGTSTTVTAPSGVSFSTLSFADVIESGGRFTYPFTVNTAGPVTVTLASVVNADTGVPLERPLRVGVGRVVEEVCEVQTSALVQAALTTQVTHLASEGAGCVEIADPTGLPGPIRFTVRFRHP